MFKSSEIISKQIVSLGDGAILGTACAFVFNQKYDKAESIVFFNDDSEGGEQCVNTKKIMSKGDVLVVKNDDCVFGLLPENNLIGLPAVSSHGEDLGSIIDVYFNDKFEILSVLTTRNVIIPKCLISKVGINVVIVKLNEDEKISCRKKPKFENVFAEEIKVNILQIGDVEEKQKNIVPPKLFASTHLIMGKRTTKTLFAPSGEIVVKDGQIIDSNVISRVKKFNLINHLALNCK